MNFFATCSASVTLSYQVHVKVCNPIPLIKLYILVIIAPNNSVVHVIGKVIESES